MADERIDKGMQSQLATRERESAERPPVGWKLGFGTAAAMEKLSISEPLVGYLTEATRIDGGAEVDLSVFSNPKLEPELAITMGSDLPQDATDDEVRAAIASVGPAFEIADLDPDEDSVERILAGDIFHRGFALGAAGPADLIDDPQMRLTGADGEDQELDVYGATGEPIGLLRSLAGTLAAQGQTLGAGDVVICGSIIPPSDPNPGESYALALEGAGIAEIRFAS
ncbi:hypothetical protein HJD18_09725 [Thermoleophilia bacterium SCSIO 60948]|nr:hypothetical protein HJD18_09725 [Thermoleophilia bacterium SCSIO 60948]